VLRRHEDVQVNLSSVYDAYCNIGDLSQIKRRETVIAASN